MVTLDLAFTQVCAPLAVAGSCAVIILVALFMTVHLAFDFDVQSLHSIFQKNTGAMAIARVQEF